MVNPILEIRKIEPTNIENLSSDEYLFIYFSHNLELLFKVISNELNVGVYDEMFYVFDCDGKLVFKTNVKNIESMFAYKINGECNG